VKDEKKKAEDKAAAEAKPKKKKSLLYRIRKSFSSKPKYSSV